MRSKRRLRWLVLPLVTLIVLVSVLAAPLVVLAETSQDVTVTAAPSYITVTNSPNTWTINGIDGSGNILPDTVYYANPAGSDDTTPPSATVLDTECYFTADTTGSSVNTDLTVTCGDFTGGGADMTNSDSDGSNGATTYGMFCWYEGMTYSSKVVVKSTGSADMKSNHAAGELDWGVEIETRTDAWSSGTSSTTGAGERLTITVTAS